MSGVLRYINSNTKHDLPMQHFTQTDFQPQPTTILFIKQFARMCNSNKTLTNGYNSFSVAACS